MKQIKNLIAVLPFTFIACSGGTDDGTGNSPDTLSPDEEVKLQQHLRAIPKKERVAVVAPLDADAQGSPEGSAEFAQYSIRAANNVNGPALAMVELLSAVTEYPPTVYNSDTNEFVWGPGENEDGVGQIMVYIRENGADKDFQYEYAFLRLVDNDLATASPVIWGGSNPDPEDPEKGVGITLWDFDANNAFEAQHDPAFTLENKDHGRVAMMYGEDSEAAGVGRYNVAVFRDFIPADAKAEDPQPFDSEYFYGHVQEPDGPRLDFLDWQLSGDLCDTDPGSCFDNNVIADESETFGLRTVFVDRGLGRAEVEVAGGDLSSDVSVVECWDENLDRTYLNLSVAGATIGEEGACTGGLESTLTELGVPSVDDVDAELMAALTCVAENGIDGDC